jgi:hypothetical protein
MVAIDKGTLDCVDISADFTVIQGLKTNGTLQPEDIFVVREVVGYKGIA